MCHFISTTIYPSFTLNEVRGISLTLVLTNRGTQFLELMAGRMWKRTERKSQQTACNQGLRLHVSPWKASALSRGSLVV